MATRAHLKSEIENIDRDIAAHHDDLASHVARHGEKLGKLHARKAFLDHAHSQLADEDEVVDAQGKAIEAARELPTTQETAKAPVTTEAGAGASQAAKTRRGPRGKARQASQAEAKPVEVEAKSGKPGRKPRKNAKATQAKGATEAVASEAKPAGKRVRNRSKAALAAKVEQASAPAAAPASSGQPAAQGDAQASAGKQNPLTLKALDTLRHSGKDQMKSGDIAKEIGVAARGMGPIMSPLTATGEVVRTNVGDNIMYSLPTQAGGEGAATH